jgi:hypothetical protein
MTGQTEHIEEQPPQIEMSDEDLFEAEVARRRGVAVEDLQSFSGESIKQEDDEQLDVDEGEGDAAPPEKQAKPEKAPKQQVEKQPKPAQQVVEEDKPAWYADASDEVKAAFDALNKDLSDTRTQYTALHGRLAPVQQANERLRQKLEQVGQSPQAPTNSSAASSQQPGRQPHVQPPTPKLDLAEVPEFEEFRAAFPEEAKAIAALFGRQAQHVDNLQQQLGSVSQGLEQIQQASFGKAREDGLNRLSAAHPDWMNIRPSEDFGRWLQTQPRNVAVLADSQDADECIWILDRYKQDVWAQRQLQNPPAPASSQPQSTVQTVRSRRQQLRSVPGLDPQGSDVGLPQGTPQEFMTDEQIWDEEVKRRLRAQRDNRM